MPTNNYSGPENIDARGSTWNFVEGDQYNTAQATHQVNATAQRTLGKLQAIVEMLLPVIYLHIALAFLKEFFRVVVDVLAILVHMIVGLLQLVVYLVIVLFLVLCFLD